MCLKEAFPFCAQIVRYLQENPRLLEGENGKRIERVLDRLVEKMMKSHDTNEVRADFCTGSHFETGTGSGTDIMQKPFTLAVSGASTEHLKAIEIQLETASGPEKRVHNPFFPVPCSDAV